MACASRGSIPASREFARALAVLAKTDKVDARVLAEMGLRPSLEVATPPDPAQVRLADVLRRRKRLVEMRKAEKNRRHGAGQSEASPGAPSSPPAPNSSAPFPA